MNTILFDLDGTLLPLDIDIFTRLYFKKLSVFFEDLIDGKELMNHILGSTLTVINNLENRTNEEVFMEDFQSRLSCDIDVYKQRFDSFYDTAFTKIKAAARSNPHIIESVQILKQKGYSML